MPSGRISVSTRDVALFALLVANLVLCVVVLVRVGGIECGAAAPVASGDSRVDGGAMPRGLFNNETIVDLLNAIDDGIDEHRYASHLRWAISSERGAGRLPDDRLLAGATSAMARHRLERLLAASAANGARLDTLIEIMRESPSRV